MSARKTAPFLSTLREKLSRSVGVSLRSRTESAPDFEDLRSLLPTHHENETGMEATSNSAPAASEDVYSASHGKRQKGKRLEFAISAVFVLLFGLALLVLCKQYLGLLMSWLMQVGGWEGPALYSTFIVLTAFPMIWGYMILNVGAGYIYGIYFGVLITSASCTIGSLLAFVTCKTICKHCIGRVSKQFANFKQLVKVLEGKQGLRIMMMTRLTPVPIGLQNALFAAADISVKRCFAATFFGLLPTQILNAYMGSTLRSMDDVVSGEGSGTILVLAQIVIAIVVTIYVNHRMKKEVTKACEREYIAAQARAAALRAQRTRESIEAELLSQDQAGTEDGDDGTFGVEAVEILQTAKTYVNPFAEDENGHFGSALLASMDNIELSPRSSTSSMHGTREVSPVASPVAISPSRDERGRKYANSGPERAADLVAPGAVDHSTAGLAGVLEEEDE